MRLSWYRIYWTDYCRFSIMDEVKVRDVIKEVEADGWYFVRQKKMQFRYLVVVEKGDNNYSAYAPDVPGCVTTGKTLQETLSNMREALELYFEVTLEDGVSIPIPYATYADFVEFEIPTPASTAARGSARTGRQARARREPDTRAAG